MFKKLWEAVRQFTGRKRNVGTDISGITAGSLNQHYADISTDAEYSEPIVKYSACCSENQYISEWEVFKHLDTLRHTATGLDMLPAWFLKLGAAVFCKPLTRLFKQSVTTSTVPTQWKAAYITPVPKVAVPARHADFRPISITPILSRIMEKTVVRHFIYPALSTPPPFLTFRDQFAYLPTGSTTAAVIQILHTVTHLLASYDSVSVIALDFTKAFDTVRHSTLLHKMANIAIPDAVYNWLVSYFCNHSHCSTALSTVEVSSTCMLDITAGIIQGSGIGPASYVISYNCRRPENDQQLQLPIQICR